MQDPEGIVLIQNRSAEPRTVTFDGRAIVFGPRERKLMVWGKAQHVLKHAVLVENRYTGAVERWAEEVAEGVEAPALPPELEHPLTRTALDAAVAPDGMTPATVLDLRGAGSDLAALAAQAEARAPSVLAESAARAAGEHASRQGEDAYLDEMSEAAARDAEAMA